MVLINWTYYLTLLKVLILASLLEIKGSYIKKSAEISKLPGVLNSGKTSHSNLHYVDVRPKTSPQNFYPLANFLSTNSDITKSSKEFLRVPQTLKIVHLRSRIIPHKNFSQKLYFEKQVPKKPLALREEGTRSLYYFKEYLHKRVGLRHKRQSGSVNYTSTSTNITIETPVSQILNTPGVANNVGENKTSLEVGDKDTAVNSSVRSAVKETSTTIVSDTLPSGVGSNLTGSEILSQISHASGDGNKAGVTPLHTTPLSKGSINSHALINSSPSPENSTSKFSRQVDNVTSYVEEPKAEGVSNQTIPVSTIGLQPPAVSSITLQRSTQPVTFLTTTRNSQLSTPSVQLTVKTVRPVSATQTQKTPNDSTSTSVKTTTPPPLSTIPKAEPSPEPSPEPSQTAISGSVNQSAEREIVSQSINNVGSNHKPENTPQEGQTLDSSSVVTTRKLPPNGSSTAQPLPDKLSRLPKPEPEPEPERVTMATNNTTTTDIPSPEPTPFPPFAEPIPDWKKAKIVWREAWPIHIYSMGTAFALLAVFSLISIVRLWRIKHLFSQKYFITLNLLMFLMGLIRAIYLLIDGYNSQSIYPRVVDYFLFSTGFPCLTSAFSILFFALLQATRMQLVGPRVQKIQVLIAIIVCHFGISIITDVVVGYFYGAQIMLFLCELVSVVWGLFLVIGYCYIFRRLYAAALKRQRVMERLSNVRSSQSPAVNGKGVSDRKPSDSSVTVKPTQKYTLSLAVKVTLGTAILGLVYIGLEMYGMFGVFGVFSKETPEPWPWWGFEFGLRLVELLMCVTMSYIGTQPFRYVEGLRNRRWCFYCAACRDLIRPRCGTKAGNDHLAWDDIDGTNSAGSQADAQQSCIVYRKKTKCKAPAKKPMPYEAIQMQVKNSQTNEHDGSNGHINPSLESGVESRPVSMLVVEDGFIRFRNDAELVMAMSSGSDSLVRDSAVLKADDCANDLVNGATLVLSKTNFNTNCSADHHSMPCGDGTNDLSNIEHVHGIVNDGYSGGADSSRNSGVISDTNPNSPPDHQLAAGKSDAHSASSMQSYSCSHFSESIEQELQNLIIRKPSLSMEKAKSSTNLPDETKDNYFTNSLIFTQKPDHVLTGIRSPPHEQVLQYSLLARSMPCSPIKTPLQSPSDKRKLLSRSNSDHLPVFKHASVRTKVFNNAKYFSLSDLELQIKSDDLQQGPELVHQPPQFDPVKLISSRKVSDPDTRNEPANNGKETISPQNSSKPPSTKKPPSSKTTKPGEERSRPVDSDHSEC